MNQSSKLSYHKIQLNTAYANKCFLFMVFYFMGGNDAIHSFLMTFRSFVSIPGNIDKYVEYAVICIILLLSLRTIDIKVSKKETIVFFFFSLAFLVSWAKQDGYNSMYISMLWQIGYGLIAYFYFKSIDSFKEIQKCFDILAIMLSLSISLQILSIGTMSRLSYSQSLAYSLLPAAIISISEAFRRTSVLHIINSIYSSLLIFTMGTRWPLVCIGLFIVIKIATGFQFSRKKGVFLLVVLFFFTIILVNMDFILDHLGAIIPRYGLSRRSLISIRSTEFFEGNGRELLWQFSIRHIKNNPFLGYGIGSDRVLIANYMGLPSLASGYYPHNIFIEFLFQFGVVIGGLLILILLNIIRKALKQALIMSDHDNYLAFDVVLIMIVLGIFPLFVSSSYILWIPFYELLGVCSVIQKDRKTIALAGDSYA